MGRGENMMNKQELIKNIKSLAREASQQWPHEEMVELPDVLREIDQLEEPEVLSQELPVIPKYISDWFEENKEHFEDRLKSAIKYREINDGPSDFDVWLDNPHNKPLQTLGNMFNGYEVEEEQKYYVINKEKELILGWSQSAYMTPCIEGYEYMKHNGRENLFQLTEQEIKDYDKRYIPFMIPVEEMG